MSEQPTILLIELNQRSAAFVQALSQVGRPAVAIGMSQLSSALTQVSPLCLVAHEKQMSEVAGIIRAAKFNFKLPFFLLTEEGRGSMRPSLPEVTATVSEEIDPGILALQIQKALQQAGGLRPRQATVAGLGDLSFSVPAQKVPQISTPAAAVPRAKLSQPAASPQKAPAASAPAPAPISSPAVPWESPVVSSAPPLPDDALAAPPPSVRGGVHSSAPPLPDFSPLPPGVSAPASVPPGVSAPAAATPPLKASIPPSAVSASAQPSSSAPPVDTHRPVTLQPPEAANPFEKPASKKKYLVLGAAAALALGAVGFVVSSGGETQSPSASLEAVAPETGSAQNAAAQPTAQDIKPAAKVEPKQEQEPKQEAEPAQEQDAKPADMQPEAAEPSGAAAYYQIKDPIDLKSCEEILGKTQKDFAGTKTWKATSFWKLARKNLMSGKEDAAQENMCQAAFIDMSGPATAGLVKFYLSKRALSQAETWGKLAVESAKAGAPKRNAQQLLADVYIQQGKVEEARALWLESFGLTADQTDRLLKVSKTFVSAANTARKGGDAPLAEQMLRRASLFDPENATTAALLASILLANDQKSLADMWAQKAKQLDPSLELGEDYRPR